MRFTWTNSNDPDIESPRCTECNEYIDPGETAIVTVTCKRNYKAQAFMNDKRMVWSFNDWSYIHYPSCVRDRNDINAGLSKVRSEDAEYTGPQAVILY